MWNLKLKNTSYASMVAAIKAKKGGRKGMIVLGSNTEAGFLYDTPGAETVGIYYHGNKIVTLDKSGIVFSNAGWGTPTTRNRLGIIANDNNVPVWFGQKNFRQTLTARRRMWNDDSATRHLITDDFRSIIWDRATDTLHSDVHNIDYFAL